MTVFTWFLLALIGIFIVLGILLVVTFIRLGNELQRIGDDTASLVKRAQQTIKKVQIAIPIAVFLKNTHTKLVKQVGNIAKKERRNDKKTK